jgi:hypothetical protein
MTQENLLAVYDELCQMLATDKATKVEVDN